MSQLSNNQEFVERIDTWNEQRPQDKLAAFVAARTAAVGGIDDLDL